MLSVSTVAEVKRLLTTGLSARAVARRTGASRGSVLNIARGRRAERFGSDPGDDTDGELWSPIDGYRAERCRDCGALAYIRPRDRRRCTACRVRLARRVAA